MGGDHFLIVEVDHFFGVFYNGGGIGSEVQFLVAHAKDEGA